MEDEVFSGAFDGAMGMYDEMVKSGMSPRRAAAMCVVMIMCGVKLAENGMDPMGPCASQTILGMALTKYAQLYKEPVAETPES